MNEHTKVADRIEDYARKSVFASFLPGIAGIKGTPVWCYYVNRGQAVVSFGVRDKDHAIMEFYPAHTAYQTVKRTGFRTFLRVNGKYTEPFQTERDTQVMEITMNGLSITDEDPARGLRTNVRYTALPGEEIGALLRIVTLTNTGDEPAELEVLDGMPAVVPYGVGQESLKMMTQTTKAWMQVEDTDKGVPYFRVRVSMEDSAEVKGVEGGNFALGRGEDGSALSVITDPGVIFSYDLSLAEAVTFRDGGLAAVEGRTQHTQNEFPCCFFRAKQTLAPGESLTLYELMGQVRSKQVLSRFMEKKIDRAYFETKLSEAEKLTDTLTDAVSTETADPVFDAYTRYNYMDNVLRGGTPVRLPGGHPFYVYSRKHGDLERDYNYFSMTPEFYSQGNGNFRDVNQNRRCDTFFSEIVGDRNIRMFYGLLQLDGYNPLKIEQSRFSCDPAMVGDLSLTQPFTPGELYAALSDQAASSAADGTGAAGAAKTGGMDPQGAADAVGARFEKILAASEEAVNADFGEGYWSDHFTYNLDLIEEYLELYPDREETLLFESEIPSFDPPVEVLPRVKRYAETKNGLRQYHFTKPRAAKANGGAHADETHAAGSENASYPAGFAKDKNGQEITMSLAAKLLLLSAIKTATLDAAGLGIEMEGGKPGWYDALNGMPGMLGASMAETYETLRMVRFSLAAAKRFSRALTLPKEAADFVREIAAAEADALRQGGQSNGTKAGTDALNPEISKESIALWNLKNDAKEAYRAKVYAGLSGKAETLEAASVTDILERFEARLTAATETAVRINPRHIAPAYFTYEVPDYEKTAEGIWPKAFVRKDVPDFLEGPVRYLKIEADPAKRTALYAAVKDSDLYDPALSMYKVNASLKDASYELGRCRAFTPGWLENESIWLHMEYKYLLELLRGGLYEAFFEDFKNAAVPFLDPAVYGRSTLENSSFIASSKNPNEDIRGKGFVARLSGSTVEFISMWKLLFFGRELFTVGEHGLRFTLSPALPAYLWKEEDGSFTASAMLLGRTKVTYVCTEKTDYMPGRYEITEITLVTAKGETQTVNGGTLEGRLAEAVRNREAESLTVSLRPAVK